MNQYFQGLLILSAMAACNGITLEVHLDAVEYRIRSRATNMGNLVADSVLWAVNQEALEEVSVGLVNGGGIRGDKVYETLSPQIINEVLPFNNELVRVDGVTLSELKEMLEHSVSGLKDHSGRFLQVSGVSFAHDPVAPVGSRIRHAQLSNGTMFVHDGEFLAGSGDIRVNIATTAFLAGGGDGYPELTYDTTLATEQTALLEYITIELDNVVSTADYPEGGDGRIMMTPTLSVDVELDAVEYRIRSRATNMGNLVADSVLWAVNKFSLDDGESTASVGLVNGGGIRGDKVYETLSPQIINEVLPFNNELVRVDGVTLSELKEMLEHSVSGLKDHSGRFLQVSGVSFAHDPVAPVGSRIRHAQLSNGTMFVHGGELLAGTGDIRVNIATTAFLAGGGDGYPEMGEEQVEEKKVRERDALLGYVIHDLEGTVSSEAYPEGGDGRIMMTPTLSVDVELDAVEYRIRSRATNMGNLVADSVLWAVNKFSLDDGESTASVGLVNGGGIRGDKVYETLSPQIINEVLPFNNELVRVDGVTLSELKEMLEHSVSGLKDHSGRFLQVSGVSFAHDPVAPVGSRIRHAQLSNGTMFVHGGELLAGTGDIRVNIATTAFLAGGGDGYPEMGEEQVEEKKVRERDALLGYVIHDLEGTVSSEAYPEGGDGRIMMTPTLSVDVELDAVEYRIRSRATNMGNLVADSVLWAVNKFSLDDGESTASVGLVNGGGIRGDKVYETLSPQIINEVLPFNNELVRVDGVTLSELKEMLEHSVSGLKDHSGRFLQVSGVSFAHDPVAPVGSRIRHAQLSNGTMFVHGGELLAGTGDIRVNIATTAFLAGGGDGYPEMGEEQVEEKKVRERDALLGYVIHDLEGTVSSEAYPEGGDGRIMMTPTLSVDVELDAVEYRIRSRATNMGNLVADSVLWAVNKFSLDDGESTASVGLVNGGGIRGDKVYETLSPQIINEVLPFNNELVRVDGVTLSELKEMLEHSVSGLKDHSGRFLQVSGVSFAHDPVAPVGSRIRHAQLSNGTMFVHGGELLAGTGDIRVNIATTAFLAGGGDGYPEMGEEQVEEKKVRERDALLGYVIHDLEGTVSSEAYPEGGDGRIMMTPTLSVDVELDAVEYRIRSRATNMGNLVADSVLWAVNKFSLDDGESTASVGLVNGGGIRGDKVYETLSPQIINEVLPFNNELVRVDGVTLSELKEMLEHSVSGLKDHSGRFLQVSGVSFAHDPVAPVGSRIRHAQLSNGTMFVHGGELLAGTGDIRVNIATTAFLAGGGDGYPEMGEEQVEEKKVRERDALLGYVIHDLEGTVSSEAYPEGGDGRIMMTPTLSVDVELDAVEYRIRSRATNMGNLVADSVLWAVNKFSLDDGESTASVGLVNGGGIRGDKVYETLSPQIINEVLPFNNELVRVDGVTLSELKEMLEHSVSGLKDHSGRFLQVSGVSFAHDPVAPVGSRIRHAQLSNGTMFVHGGELLAGTGDIRVNIATTAFLAGGGDGYPEMGEEQVEEKKVRERDALLGYVIHDLEGTVSSEAYPEGGDGRIMMTPTLSVDVELDAVEYRIRSRATNMGNLVADSVLWAVNKFSLDDGESTASVGLVNGGGIRGDKVYETLSPQIINEVLPFNNELVRVDGVTLSELKEMLEHSVSGLKDHSGRFLQVSGVSFAHDPVAPVGSRIRHAQLSNGTMFVHGGELLAGTGDIRVNIATTAFLAGGGDGYPEMGEEQVEEKKVRERDALLGYVIHDLEGTVSSEAYPEGGDGRIMMTPTLSVDVELDAVEYRIRSRATNMGNLVADSVLWAVNKFSLDDGESTASVGLVNGGGIRGDKVYETLSPQIINEVLPFNNELVRVDGVTLSELKEMLEHSVSGLKDHSGRFLQVSGVSFAHDPVAPVGSRIRHAQLSNGTMFVHDGELLAGTGDIRVNIATTAFLAGGGDGYPEMGEEQVEEKKVRERDALLGYVIHDLEGTVSSEAYPEGGDGRIMMTPTLSVDVELDAVEYRIRSRATNMGNLVADSVLWAVNKFSLDDGESTASVGLVNGGGIRGDKVYETLSPQIINEVLRFNNELVRVDGVTLSELKEMLEHSVSRIQFRSGRFLQVSGVSFAHDPVAPVGSRIRHAQLSNGTMFVHDGELLAGTGDIRVNIATTAFLAGGGDGYTKVGEVEETKVRERDALLGYVIHDLEGTVSSEAYPEGGDGRISPVTNACLDMDSPYVTYTRRSSSLYTAHCVSDIQATIMDGLDTDEGQALKLLTKASLPFGCSSGVRTPATQLSCKYEPCVIGTNCSAALTNYFSTEPVQVVPSAVQVKFNAFGKGNFASDVVAVNAPKQRRGAPLSFSVDTPSGFSLQTTTAFAFRWKQYDSPTDVAAMVVIRDCFEGLQCSEELTDLFRDTSLWMEDLNEEISAMFEIDGMYDVLLTQTDSSVVEVSTAGNSNSVEVDTDQMAANGGEWAVWMRLDAVSNGRLLQSRALADPVNYANVHLGFEVESSEEDTGSDAGNNNGGDNDEDNDWIWGVVGGIIGAIVIAAALLIYSRRRKSSEQPTTYELPTVDKV